MSDIEARLVAIVNDHCEVPPEHESEPLGFQRGWELCARSILRRLLLAETDEEAKPPKEAFPTAEPMTEREALKRAAKLIDWMSRHVGLMSSGYENCYIDLNAHFIYMREIEDEELRNELDRSDEPIRPA